MNVSVLLKQFQRGVLTTHQTLEKLLITLQTAIVVEAKKLHPDAILPKYNSDTAAGADLYALEDGILNPGETKLIKTGIALEIPVGYYGRVAEKSGHALKVSLNVGGGVIDSDYRGEIGVIARNLGNMPFMWKKGDKVAQIIFYQLPKTVIVETVSLSETNRGEGGFGSTGK